MYTLHLLRAAVPSARGETVLTDNWALVLWESLFFASLHRTLHITLAWVGRVPPWSRVVATIRFC